jgi:xanthine dehydrogenase molybdenum-binding subunit
MAFTYIGKRYPRLDGTGVVTSRGQYVSNMAVPGMLFARVLRSPHPHARVLRVDASKAEQLPGVVKVFHYFNVPKDLNVVVNRVPVERRIFSQE